MVSLWMVTGILLYLAFIRLLHSDYHIEGGAMLLTASIAVCANLLYVPVGSGAPGALGRGVLLRGWGGAGSLCAPKGMHQAHTVLPCQLP